MIFLSGKIVKVKVKKRKWSVFMIIKSRKLMLELLVVQKCTVIVIFIIFIIVMYNVLLEMMTILKRWFK